MAEVRVINNLQEAAEFYVEFCIAKGFSEHTAKSKLVSLERFRLWALRQGVTHPKDVDLELLEQYRLYLHNYISLKTHKPLGISTQATDLVHVKMMMRQLFRRRVITHNSCEWFEIPKVPRSLPPIILKVPDIERILMQTYFAGPIGVRDRAILEVFYASGVRRAELSRLKIADVDTVANTIRVTGKGKRERLIPLAPRACRAILKYTRECRPKLISVDSDDTLFLSRAGTPISFTKMTDLVANYVRRSGFSAGACHLFRHATATLMLDGGADIRHVQEQLGHACIASTQIYTHVSIKQLERVYHNTHPASQLPGDAASANY
jgi:integrase/recombinase XerD